MKAFVTIVLVATALLTTACSGNLSRSRAEDILRAKLPPSNAQQQRILISTDGLCFEQRRNPCGADAMPAPTKRLEKLDLISVAYEGNTSRMSITEKGRKYTVRPDAAFPVFDSSRMRSAL